MLIKNEVNDMLGMKNILPSTSGSDSSWLSGHIQQVALDGPGYPRGRPYGQFYF